MKKTFLILLSFMILFGCRKEKYLTTPIETKGILFQYEYLNYAWGYSHQGYLIDSAGYVHGYKLPVKWNFPDSTRFLSLSQMNENLSQTDTVFFQVPKTELEIYKSKIQSAAKGLLTKPVNEMYDAGSSSFYGFIYDSNAKKYKRFLINQTGDWEIENQSEAAKTIYNWLLSINNSRL